MLGSRSLLALSFMLSFVIPGFVFAADVTLYGPERVFSPLTGTKTKTVSFAGPAAPSEGELILVNGSGEDLSAKSCSGLGLVAKIVCSAMNLVNAVRLEVERPSSVEVSFNGVVVLKPAQLPKTVNTLTIPLNLKATNQLTLKIKGSILSSVSLQVRKRNDESPLVKPIASFTLSADQPIVPTVVRADASASTTGNAGGIIVGYDWHITAPNGTDYWLHDISVAEIQIPDLYTYTISLEVRDSYGQVSDPVTKTFTPTNTRPLAFIWGGDLVDTAPSELIFYGAGSYDPDGHEIIAWQWTFSDGAKIYGPIPSHTFHSPGVYTVTLRVQDAYWTWSEPQSITVTILENQAPLAFIQVQDVPGSRYQKILNASMSYDPEGFISGYYWWISGQEGLIGTGESVEYAFPGDGTYELNLDVYDNKGLRGSRQMIVEIVGNLAPMARFKSTPLKNEPFKIEFDASESTDEGSIANYSWTFSDGTTASGALVSHDFSKDDFYSVKLVVTDNEGAYGEKEITVHAMDYTDRAPTAVISGKEDEPNLITERSPASIKLLAMPGVVSLSAEESDIAPDSREGARYVWDAGVFGVYEGPDLVLDINRPGIFPIVLTITDNQGRSGSSTTNVEGSLEACGEYDGDNICPYLVGRTDSSIDAEASVVRIATGVDYEIDPASILNPHSISVESSEGRSIDISSLSTPVGANIEIPTEALLQELAGHPEPYNIRISVGSVDGEQSGVGPLRNVVIARRSLSVQVPDGATELEVVAGGSNFKFRKSLVSGTVVVGLRPDGSYTASALTPNGRVTKTITLDADSDGRIDLTDVTSLGEGALSEPMSSRNAVDSISSLPGYRYVNPLPFSSPNGKMSSRSFVTTENLANYNSWCGEPPPYPLVSVGPHEVPDNRVWGKFLSNNLATEQDPQASIYSPLSQKSIKEKKISGYCQLQLATYLKSEYWNWFLQANLRCCRDNECRKEAYRIDSLLRQRTHLEATTLSYVAEFMDQDSTRKETKVVNTTFQKTAAKVGYDRTTMSATIGLPVSDHVPGWG